ncbi:hypothetical protein [Hymenobacter rubidus]|uniref:hypothetical protein n=1 Tax=Hymenobacter rubidus TaxID=1441626 RepID=UPI00191F1938|nr:hypothetical protein [Hymenobacter rubidus]
METQLITKYRIFKMALDGPATSHSKSWTFRPLLGEENHEFDSTQAAHEWIAENPEIMIRSREFTILPVYHLVLA